MIHARLDLSKSRSTAVGTMHGPEGPAIWFCCEGIKVPEMSDEDSENDLLLTLTVSDAAALSTLLDQSVLECINGRGKVN